MKIYALTSSEMHSFLNLLFLTRQLATAIGNWKKEKILKVISLYIRMLFNVMSLSLLILLPHIIYLFFVHSKSGSAPLAIRLTVFVCHVMGVRLINQFNFHL